MRNPAHACMRANKKKGGASLALYMSYSQFCAIWEEFHGMMTSIYLFEPTIGHHFEGLTKNTLQTI